jgi:hypothetical protein
LAITAVFVRGSKIISRIVRAELVSINALLVIYFWIVGKPHVTLLGVGCCSRARVCLDRRSETQIFVDPGAFIVTDSNDELLLL